MRKLILAVLCAFLFSASASAQTLCQWRDTLSNPGGQVIPNATVIVLAGTIGGSAAVNTNTKPGTPLATIFADPYGATPINQTTNPINTATLNGSFQFWSACGAYLVIQAYGPQIAQQYVYGIRLPGSSNGGTPGGINGNLQLNFGGTFAGAGGLNSPDGDLLHIQGPIPWIDATTFGLRALATFNTITVTSPGTSSSVTTTGISDFQAQDGLAIPRAGPATAQSTPAAPTVTPIGATNSVTINYKCVAVDAHWGLTAASAAGTTSTAPTVFGAPAVGITSIVRLSNVVTVTASATMPFSTGTFHAVIANITGGTTQFSGLQLVTVTSGTTLTYNQTGANESGTRSSNSYVLFENAFVLTTVQATAGSNQLVLTTDVNHNIQFHSSGTRPTKIFLDGINFSGATPSAYADGLFGVAAVTANTITVTTSYTSPITVTGTASGGVATSTVAQMTATVWPVIDVACPAISGTTKYYAVYGDYGSGYAPIGFTPWLANIFEDYGPGFSKTGFIPPVAMNLPASPPVAAQNQVFTGQIQSIAGSTLTLTGNVPSAVTSVTAYHDNGSALLNALASSCTNGGGGGSNSQGFAPVYLPQQALGGATTWTYLFSAPVNVSTTCNRINIVDGGTVTLDGTVYADSAGQFEWSRPQSLSGWINYQNDMGGGVEIYGHASPEMVPGISGAKIQGMIFNTQSSGQIGLQIIGSHTTLKEDGFITVSKPSLTSMPLVISPTSNNGFQDKLDTIYWSADRNFQYPVPATGNNIEVGQAAWWPVPAIDLLGPVYPNLYLEGINYGNARGIQIDNLYGNGAAPPQFSFSNVQTLQDPWQPFLTMYGQNGSKILRLNITRVQTDSLQMPDAACVTSDGSSCVTLYTSDGALTQADGTDPSFTGSPSSNAFEYLSHGAAPAQNTNETSLGSGGPQVYGSNSGTNPAYQISCEGGTGYGLSVRDPTLAIITGIPCPVVSGTLASIVCSGTLALGTTLIASPGKTSLTMVCTGLAATDNVIASFNADPTSTTGYIPSTSGMLTLVAWPTTNTVNVDVINNTSSSITPGASLTLNVIGMHHP